MAGRNDAAVAAALEAVAQAIGQQPNAGANAEVRMLETFLRNQPPTFKGEMVVETPSNGSVTTSRVCLSCPLSIRERLCYGSSLHAIDRNGCDSWYELVGV
jgi:hypothetical protein